MNVHNTSEKIPTPERVFLIGQNGTGKTAQAITFPGKTFGFLFDPGAVKTLELHNDIAYSTYFHDILDLTPKGITKSGAAPVKTMTQVKEPESYKTFAKDFVEATQNDFFSSYDNIILDNTTMLQACVMDQVLFQARRYGTQPEIGDYATLAVTMLKVIRSLVALNKNILLIGHDDYYQDDKTKRIGNHPILVGALKTQIPLLFNNVLRCEMEEDKGNLSYWIEAVKYEKAKFIRTSIPNPQARMDVTIKDFKNPTAYGLGKLLFS